MTLLEQVMQGFARDRELAPLVEAVVSSTGWERFRALRQFYAEVDSLIRSVPAHRWAIDPYTIDWVRVFTPIEFGLWGDIRAQGVVLYPQYPVGRYFADFANPLARVVIECDGARWHHDAHKDAERQQNIEAMGWRVYRFTGRQCLEPDEIEDEESGSGFVRNPDRAGAMLREIARAHGISFRYAR